MKKSFTLGAVAGITSLAIAFPIVAQISSAQSSAGTSAAANVFVRRKPDTTQAGVQTLIEHDATFLANIDAAVSAHKTAVQTHKTALEAAVTIADDTARADAVQDANETLHTSMQAYAEAHPELKGGMMPFGGHDKGHFMMKAPSPAELAEKLRMTEADLQAALDSGKTIPEIAEEKGLPARPMGMRGKGNMHMRGEAGVQ